MDTERPGPNLSPREQQLLKYAAEGYTDIAIADRLGISEATVGTYWGRVRIKFGPYSRTELVAMMLRAESMAAVNTIKQENAILVEDLQLRLASGAALAVKDLIERAPDAVFIISAQGAIEYANAVADEMFGYDRGELAGKNHNILVPPQLRAIHTAYSQTYITDPCRRSMGQHTRTPAVKKDGTEFQINATLSAIESDNGVLVICAVRS